MKIIQNQWISVEDDPPSEGEWVLVYASGAMNCMWWYEHRWQDPIMAQAHNIVVFEEITHWMRLPRPPMQVMET